MKVDSKDDLQLLSEGRFIDSAILLVLTTRLLKPFKTWNAFKYGVIDENGDVVRKPETNKEKDSWTLLDRFLAKIKKAFIKHKLVGSMLSYYILMKESSSISDKDVEYLVEQRQKERKIKELHFKIKTLLYNEGLSEDEYFRILTNIKIKEKDNL